MNNISQIEICAQKDLPSTLNKLKSLKTSSTSIGEYQKLRAAFYTTKEWSANKEITVYFMNEPPSNISIKNYPLNALDGNGNPIKWDPLQVEIINNYTNFRITDIIPMIKRVLLERIQPIVNLKFNFVDDPFAMIRINFDTYAGSWSYLGKDALSIPYNEATINFGWFNIATVLHEFGHMLGLIHEHQSPFGEPIPWNKTEVYKWAADTQKWSQQQTDAQIINKYNYTLLNGTVFDPKSIMLYFYPKSLTTNNTGTSMNVRLSPYDVFYINSRYPRSSQTPIEFYKNVYGEDITNIIPTTTYKPIQTTIQPIIPTTTYKPIQTTIQPIIPTTTYKPIQTTIQPIIPTTTYKPIQTTIQPIIPTTTYKPIQTTIQPTIPTTTYKPIQTTIQPTIPTQITTTIQPIETTTPIEPVINIIFDKLNINFLKSQTLYGDLLTIIYFKGILKNLYINTNNISQNYTIFILNNQNVPIFEKQIFSGYNEINVNLNVEYGYKINLKNTSNLNLSIRDLSGDITAFRIDNTVTTTPILTESPKKMDIKNYIYYGIIGLLVLSFAIALISRKFKIF